MPRLATRGLNSGAGSRPREAIRKADHALVTRTVAPADTLTLAPGRWGWRMPHLDGAPAVHRLWRGDRVAAAISSAMLRANVAEAHAWTVSNGDPFQFVQASLSQFVERHGGRLAQNTFPVSLAFTATLNEYAAADREVDAANLFLTIDPKEAGYLVLGPTLQVLERQHPRLPATFFHLISAALNRWVRVYDYRDALEHVERLRDWYSADPDAGEVEVPEVDASVPASALRKPLSRSAMRRVLPGCSGEVQSWMYQAMALERLAARIPRPQLPEQAQEELSDCNPPLPCLLVVFSRRDNTEACFDTEAESMMEVPPEPNLIIPINAFDQVSVRVAFATLATVCETLAAASKLIASLPDSKFNHGV